MGDALAVCLMELKGFKSEDFARFHPGGTLGKKLYLRVGDVLSQFKPFVEQGTSVKNIIVEITQNRLGAAAVLDEKGIICGVVTDGDIRRMLEKNDNISSITAKDIMTASPRVISADALAAEALEMMRHHNINQLLVKQENAYCGIIHIQDLIREGII
jgi:arabinose-5-phosphate isomerase